MPVHSIESQFPCHFPIAFPFDSSSSWALRTWSIYCSGGKGLVVANVKTALEGFGSLCRVNLDPLRKGKDTKAKP